MAAGKGLTGGENKPLNGGYILDICRGHWAARVLFTAVELGLFDVLAGLNPGCFPPGAGDMPVHPGLDGTTPARAAAALGTAPDATARLLAALHSLGLVEREGECYRNSPLAHRHLVRGKDTYLGHAVRHFANLAEGWSRLGEAVRTGRPTGFEAVERAGYAERLRDYILAMGDQASLKAEKLAAALDPGCCAHFLDLGGGPGVYTVALLKRFPAARATIMDLADTLKITAELVEAAGMAGRVELRPGDFTGDDLGEEVYDLVLASNVVHIYDAVLNRRIMARVWRALRPGGQVVIHDYVLGDEPAPEAALFDLNMLVGTLTGRVYGVREMGGWLEEAGFREISYRPLTEGSGLLVGKKEMMPPRTG
ncbi:MAG TPA: methyltransferase domain-containing protein [Desulfotomaculum sp.]|nr:methyltransferase domain-containing protein [Desulfotomaculum sp.]